MAGKVGGAADPKRANALSPKMASELTSVYRHSWRSEGVRAILLQGEGKNFSAGADLAHLRNLRDAGLEENRLDSARLRGLFESILRQPVLTLALVQGACVAGGCGLATAHDYVISTPDARFLYSEVKIGFVAALVATFLPLRLRGQHIRECLLHPEFLSADRALEIGLINRILGDGVLIAAGEEDKIITFTSDSQTHEAGSWGGLELGIGEHTHQHGTD